MHDTKRLIIENECRELTILYCQHLDQLNPKAFANIYTEDALYKPAAGPVPIIGREKILEWINRYPKHRLVRHCAMNQLVEVIDANNATGSSYAVVFREPNPQAGFFQRGAPLVASPSTATNASGPRRDG